MCLGNISEDVIVYKMTKTGLNGIVYDFSVDYNTVNIGDIIDIPNYMTKKHNIVKMPAFIKQTFIVLVLLLLGSG